MPAFEEDGPKLAEIARTLSDFRHEFRDAVSKMVRADVYVADMRTMDVKMNSLIQDNLRLNEQLKDERNDRRTLRNLAIGALLSALVAFATALVK